MKKKLVSPSSMSSVSPSLSSSLLPQSSSLKSPLSSLSTGNEFQDRNFEIYETSRNLKKTWIVKSGCHFSCVDKAKGIQIVLSKEDGSKNIQLCSPKLMVCTF